MKGLLLIIASLTSFTAVGEELTIALSENNTNALRYVEGRFSGPLAPLYACVIEQMAIPFTVLTLPQTRALRMLEQNEIDMVMPLAQTGDRDGYAQFSKPLFEVHYTLYSLLTAPEPTAEGVQVAAVWSSAVLPLIEGYGHDVILIDNYDIGIEMVKRGRVHGVVIPHASTLSLQTALEGLTANEYSTMQAGMYVAPSKPAVLASLNVAIEACNPESDTWQQPTATAASDR